LTPADSDAGLADVAAEDDDPRRAADSLVASED